MNVLMVVPWDNLGGVCGVVNHVAQYLKDRGHGVFYLRPGPSATPREEISRTGLPSFRLNCRPPSTPTSPFRSRLAFVLWLPFTLLALTALIRRLRIDIVNVHFPGPPGVHFAILRRLGIVRVVTSIHGADLLPNGTRPSEGQFGTAELLKSSDLSIAPSVAFNDAARGAWPELRAVPSAVIPNGIDPTELGIPLPGVVHEGDPYILSILQLVPYKGADVLIHAFAALATDYPALRLKLISDGPNRAEYEALASSLGLGQRVDFLGVVGRVAVADFLRHCSVFVLPSRSNSESFGIAAAEAMALDRPVIVSRIGGLPSLVEHDESGLLVPAGDVPALEDSLRRVLSDQGLRERLGRNAGIRARRDFLWSRTQSLYEHAFLGLLT